MPLPDRLRARGTESPDRVRPCRDTNRTHRSWDPVPRGTTYGRFLGRRTPPASTRTCRPPLGRCLWTTTWPWLPSAGFPKRWRPSARRHRHRRGDKGSSRARSVTVLGRDVVRVVTRSAGTGGRHGVRRLQHRHARFVEKGERRVELAGSCRGGPKSKGHAKCKSTDCKPDERTMAECYCAGCGLSECAVSASERVPEGDLRHRQRPSTAAALCRTLRPPQSIGSPSYPSAFQSRIPSSE